MADRARTAERAFLDAFRTERATSLSTRFERERTRARRWTVDAAGLRFDFSKTHWSTASHKAAEAWLKALNMPGAIRDLLGGAEVNPTEGRAALHTAFRGRAPKTDAKAVTKELSGLPPSTYYEGAATWTATLNAPEGTPGELRGYLGYQTCCDSGCDLRWLA